MDSPPAFLGFLGFLGAFLCLAWPASLQPHVVTRRIGQGGRAQEGIPACRWASLFSFFGFLGVFLCFCLACLPPAARGCSPQWLGGQGTGRNPWVCFLVFLGRGLALDAAMARGLGEEGIGFPARVSVERKDLCSVERFRAEHSDFSAVSDVLCLGEP